MNRLHRRSCASDRWARDLVKLVPWVVGRADLDANALAIGPARRLTTLRVLQRGADFVGANTWRAALLARPPVRHAGPSRTPGLGARLERSGFTDVAVDPRRGYFRFRMCRR